MRVGERFPKRSRYYKVTRVYRTIGYCGRWLPFYGFRVLAYNFHEPLVRR